MRFATVLSKDALALTVSQYSDQPNYVFRDSES